MAEREHRPWLWALTSTAVIVLGVVYLVTLPDAYGEAKRYEAAERCEGRGGEPPRCLEAVRGRIARVHSSAAGRGGRDFYLDVHVGENASFPPHRQPKTVEIEDTGEVYGHLRAGDEVELGYWGRHLARVTRTGVGSVETIASPSFDSGVQLSLGPLFLLLGGLGWWAAVALRRRSGSWTGKASFRPGPRPWWAAIGAGAVFGVTLVVALVGNAVGTDIGLVVVVWVMGAAAGAGVGALLFAIGAAVRRLRG